MGETNPENDEKKRGGFLTDHQLSKSSNSRMDDSSGLETWDTRWSDFAIVADSDEVLRCHKVLLAKCSPFFDAMLSSNLEETKNSKMEAKEYSLGTVKTFLNTFTPRPLEKISTRGKSPLNWSGYVMSTRSRGSL